MKRENRQIDVCFVSHSSQKGGSERSLLELLEGLVKAGLSCHVLLPENGPLEADLKRLSVSYRVIPYRWWTLGEHEDHRKAIEEIALQSVFVTEEIGRLNPCLIYSNTSVINIGAIAATELGIPHVWHIREYGELDHAMSFILEKKERFEYISGNSNFVIFNSNAIKNYYSIYADFNSNAVIYNNVSVSEVDVKERKIFTTTNRFRTIIVGNICEGKGQKDAILAIKELKNDGFDVELAIIGDTADPRYEKECKNIIEKEGLNDSVHIIGYLDNAFHAMKQADAVLVCSKNEAFGRVSIEGMLASKPVIGTNSGGTAELIIDGVSGLLYEPEDFQQLKGKIKFLIDNPEKKRKMGEEGYKFVVGSFSQNTYSKMIKDVIDTFKNEQSNIYIYNVFALAKINIIKKSLEQGMRKIVEVEALRRERTAAGVVRKRLRSELEICRAEIDRMHGTGFLSRRGEETEYSWYALEKPWRPSESRNSHRLIEPPATHETGNGSERVTLGPLASASPTSNGQEERIANNGLVSIVMPVFNNVAFTRKCVQALKKNTSNQYYEIIVIDNASTDATSVFLKSCDLQNLTVISNTENVGFTKACNQGARMARGEFVLFLNNDTEPQPGWLKALLDLMRSDDRIGIAGCRLLYPDGRLQEAGGIIFNDGSGTNYGRFDDPSGPRYSYVREVDYVSGAALLVRHDLLRKLDYFDEQYSPGYYEDTDLCFGARSLGYKVMYSPFSIVVHHEGASSGTDLSRGMKRYQVVNKQKFVQKWASALGQQYSPDSAGITMASSRSTAGNLLIIDPFLPMFDRASGSLRLFSIISLLKQQGYHITYIARDGRRNQERYRMILERMGVEVYATDPAMMRQMGCPVDAKPIDLKQILTSRPYSVAYLSFHYLACQYLPIVRSLSPLTRIVIDTVDIHFLRELREAELYRDQAAVERAEYTKKTELGIYAEADALITVTEQDWQHIEGYLPTKPHFVIPNIHSAPDNTGYSPNRSGLLFIGNFNHNPNTDAVLYFINEIFPLVKEREPDTTLRVVGVNPPDGLRQLQDKGITATGYVPSTEPYLQKARVSIAPLRYGAGMKGKIGEAMAHGLPVVTTSIGAEGMGLVHGETALIADTPAEFAQHVVKLCSDDNLWNTISKNARLFIKNNYSPQLVNTAVHNMMSRLSEMDQAPLSG